MSRLKQMDTQIDNTRAVDVTGQVLYLTRKPTCAKTTKSHGNVGFLKERQRKDGEQGEEH